MLHHENSLGLCQGCFLRFVFIFVFPLAFLVFASYINANKTIYKESEGKRDEVNLFCTSAILFKTACHDAFGRICAGVRTFVFDYDRLGHRPVDGFVIGLTKHFPISYGNCQLICAAVLFLVIIVFDMSKIGFGTIGNMVIVG